MTRSSVGTISDTVRKSVSRGLDILCEIGKLSCLSRPKTASNTDVEGWSGDVAQTIQGNRHRPDHRSGSAGVILTDLCRHVRFEGG